MVLSQSPAAQEGHEHGLGGLKASLKLHLHPEGVKNVALAGEMGISVRRVQSPQTLRSKTQKSCICTTSQVFGVQNIDLGLGGNL